MRIEGGDSERGWRGEGRERRRDMVGKAELTALTRGCWLYFDCGRCIGNWNR